MCDRRCVLVKLLPRGQRLLEGVARQRLAELRAGGAVLASELDTLLGRKPESRRVNRAQYDQTKGRGNNRAQG
jgi:DNA-binding MarR family transcriptional regulator